MNVLLMIGILIMAVIGSVFLGVSFGYFMLKDRGCCEKCGEDCKTINIYCGDDCEITLCDSDFELDDDFDDDESESESDSESTESHD